MKLVHVIYNNRLVVGKDGKQRKQNIYFVEAENGKRIAIKPLFIEGYVYLDAYSTTEYDDSLPKPKEDVKK